MRLSKAFKKLGLLFVFLIIIFGVSLLNYDNVANALKSSIISFVESGQFESENFEETYNDDFYERIKWVDFNSLIVRAMDQKITNGVIKGENGKLNFLWSTEYKFDENTEKAKVGKAIQILKYAQDKGADTLYVQRPWAISDLPYGYTFEYNKQYDFWCDQIAKNGIPTLDFRETIEDKIDFYTTDHHWTVKSSFYGAKNIIDTLSELYGYNFSNKDMYFDLENYYSKEYPDSFLGAEGVRAGQFFAGKDDFEVYYPKFETDFSFKQFADHEMYFEIEGPFEKVFIDWDKLEDPNYNNKYYSLSYNAYNENIVINNLADNNDKVLLIADSYARPMLAFMSLCFKEVRFLDPQEGRYNDSYVEYIDEYDPDIVIMMFPGEGYFEQV